MGHSQGHYLRMLLLEVFNGDSVVKQENDWNLQIPLVMCTDCRSIYDCLKKDGQTISDKSSAILMLLFFVSCVGQRELLRATGPEYFGYRPDTSVQIL